MIEVFARRNASNAMPVMWTLGELEIPHIRHDLGGSFGGTKEPGYLAMNPNGQIPTIKDGDFVLWESNAIVRYLCRCYDRAGLLLPATERGYSLADQWMDWYKTTLYLPYIDLFWEIVRTEPSRRSPGIANFRKATEEGLAILDHQLSKAGYVVGDALTMADIPFGTLAFRYLNLEIDRPSFPHIEAWHSRLLERPAFQKHVAFPFGRNPGEWERLEREGK
ncbi:glutathione S-transferase family protein [Mesorhizobium sp. B2-3-5]|uniref:glutathione S-transferase family protein n=1 Tax=Mesorhizobium sp. B2-3-5 TaxID=2589958 RepID=UPI0011292E2D|nr:glutathione S-transferase family protein [Mesorhizobium sp. B2-3-5]TPM26912.1 glutathione S-transferase family protein [Mesorhizobium sp. B2-3-5]